MEMFELGGLKDQGETVDRKSRNKVPVGSLKKEVRDDVPINISEGEFVFPADVVRYHGLEKIMNMRQDAKAGLDMMNRMGQMGNSDQATLPDNIPFQPKNFQQGGVNIQNPQVQQPQIIPDVQQQNQVPGVTFTQPTAPMVRPSIYSQKPMMPNVNVPPKVDIPKQTTYQPPQYKTPTGTAATPDFSKLIGTRFGQLQKTETKKYVNSETGEELFIPFVDGQPVYPIPDGFVFEKDVEKEKAKEKPTEAIKTTRVAGIDSDSGDDNTFTMGDTSVREDTKVPTDLTKGPDTSYVGDDPAFIGDRGVGPYGKTKTTLSTIFEDFKNDLAGGVKGIFSFIGDTFTPAESKEITSEEQNKRAQNLGLGYNDVLKNLGLENEKTNLSIGHKPGNVSPLHQKSIYNSKGHLIDLDKSKDMFNFGGSKKDSSTGIPIRGSRTDILEDIKNMNASKWGGGYTGYGSSATLSDPARKRENMYRDLTGMPPLPSKRDAINTFAGYNTGYVADKKDSSKDIYVKENGGGVITGGAWKTVNGNLQYVNEPGRGAIIGQKNPKTGKIEIGYFNRNTRNLGLLADPKVDVKIGKDIIGKGIKEYKDLQPKFSDFAPSGSAGAVGSTTTSTPLGDGQGIGGIDYTNIDPSNLPSDDPDDKGGVGGGDPGSEYGGFGDTGTPSEPGGFSDSGDFGFTAEGGFISRRRATKIKKKQGGLASR